MMKWLQIISGAHAAGPQEQSKSRPRYQDLVQYAADQKASFRRGFLRLGSQMPDQFSTQVNRRRTRLSAYGTFSLKVGLISDSGFHWSPYRDLYT
jgi:hypothetical protein